MDDVYVRGDDRQDVGAHCLSPFARLPASHPQPEVPMRLIGLVVVLVLSLTRAPLAPQAQTGKLPRIGFLGNTTAVLEANLVRPFRDGLRELGYVEGQNILIEYRWAEGKYERFPALIAELISQKVDVIVTAGTPATSPSRRRQHRSPSSWLLSAIPSVRASSRPSATPVGTSPA